MKHSLKNCGKKYGQSCVKTIVFIHGRKQLLKIAKAQATGNNTKQLIDPKATEWCVTVQRVQAATMEEYLHYLYECNKRRMTLNGIGESASRANVINIERGCEVNTAGTSRTVEEQAAENSWEIPQINATNTRKLLGSCLD